MAAIFKSKTVVSGNDIVRLYFITKNTREREGVQGVSETSNPVMVGDGGTDEKAGGGDGSGRVEDVTIFIRSDKNGQDQE